jgi:hypothetical protein
METDALKIILAILASLLSMACLWIGSRLEHRQP